MGMIYLGSMIVECAVCMCDMIHPDRNKALGDFFDRNEGGCDLMQFLCQVILICISGKTDGILLVKTACDLAQQDDLYALMEGKYDMEDALVNFVLFCFPTFFIVEPLVWYFELKFDSFSVSILFWFLVLLAVCVPMLFISADVDNLNKAKPKEDKA